MPGYEVKFVNPLLKRHECPVCLFAMRNPVQTECGHLFCRECLDPVLKRKRPICPLDKEEVNADSIFPDNACRREILNLEVYCTFVAGGCEWIGQLKNLEAHLKECDYREIQCTQCGQYIQYHILKKHEEIECPMRPEPCPHCEKDIPAQQLQHHIQKLCPKVLHLCPNDCGASSKFTLDELQKHLDVKSGTCPLMELKCPYATYGCSFVSQRKNMALHFEQNRYQHIMIQASYLSEIKEASEKTNTNVQHPMARVSNVESRCMAVEQRQDALEQMVQEKFNDLVQRETTKNNIIVNQLIRKKEEQQVVATGGGHGLGFPSSGYAPLRPLGGASVTMLSEQRDKMSDKIDGGVPFMESQTTRMNDSMSQLTRKVEELQVGATSGGHGLGFSLSSSGYAFLPPLGRTSVSVTPQRIEEMQRKVGEVEHSVDRALEQELRFQLLERATYDGILLWKIDEFDRRRREAIDGTTMSLYSTPFYTSRHGYKMCARIYLNGDGMGKNTHLSFFFVVMRGPFDGFLQWPYKQKVTLTLLNQAGKKHVSDSFRPDPNSSSFQLPGCQEINVASGCPMFIRLEHLLNGGFVKDDCIYVRVVVDALDLPEISE